MALGSQPDHRIEASPTVYAREVQQLLQAGYVWDGDYLVPSV
jgi:hypothetical protein